LSSSEVAALPDDKKKSAAAAGKSGVWLEVHCPDGSCVDKEGKVTLTAAGIEGKKDKGLWLNVFCPKTVAYGRAAPISPDLFCPSASYHVRSTGRIH